MPIRMVNDPNRDNNNSGGGGPRFGGLVKFLPLIIGFLLKRPKLLIPILIIGFLFYYFDGCNTITGGGDQNYDNSAFNTGGELDPEEYAKADIFNFLDGTNSLPQRVSLDQFAPKRLNQGAQGSCVAWANAYSARTILEARRTGKDPNSVAFSPSFMYNQIKLGNDCQGSYIVRAVENLNKYGAAPYNLMPYNPNSCTQQPSDQAYSMAQNFKIKGATRIAENPNGAMVPADVVQIKHTIAAGAPVAIGMMVGGSFMQGMMGKELWIPTRSDYDQYGFGGHAMTIIGYDDNLSGGALQIMNSWGPEWGNNGIAWIRYADFIKFNKEAYAYAPMGAVNEPIPDKFDVEFGLVNSTTGSAIPLKSISNGLFRTTGKVSPGTRFKIKIQNNIECYGYIFGQETDNSSYVLYPSTAKHSAYCGVTGSRVFPHSQSLTPDDKGTRDAFAVLISRKPIDYKKTNDAISAMRNDDYYAAFKSALGNQLINNINFRTSTGVSFTAPSADNKMALFVIEVDK